MDNLPPLDGTASAVHHAVDEVEAVSETLIEQGLPLLALRLLDATETLEPGRARLHYRRGNALRDLGKPLGALESFERALLLDPESAETLINRGTLLLALGKPEDAIASFDRALRMGRGTFAHLAYLNRGNVHLHLEAWAAALADFDQALAIQPEFTQAEYNRAVALGHLERPLDALAALDRALTLKPDSARALQMRGELLLGLQRSAEALASLERAYATAPRSNHLAGLLWSARQILASWQEQEPLRASIEADIDAGSCTCDPLAAIAMMSSAPWQQRCASVHTATFHPALPDAWPAARARAKPDRIRIGYFSSDFRNHAVAHLMAEIPALHDRGRFEVFGFSLTAAPFDALSERIGRSFDQFHDLRTASQPEALAAVQSLGIDIAIDLNGHTQGARTSLFAARCAPLQVNCLGFPGTMGAEYMDYIIADPVIIPPEHRAFYTEKVVALPHCYQPNDRQRFLPERIPSREELGLPEEAFVFACFNKALKVTPDAFTIWMRLLERVPGSILWLLQDLPQAQDNLRREAAARGIAPERLYFAPRVPLHDHLARQGTADLFLDTFYWNAHTTASEALWAGLPVLTLQGETFASRVAASLLTAIGLPELITHSAEEYEALAYRLATHPRELERLRERLVANRHTHPLFDTPRYTRNLERAYEQMWQRHCAGLAPEHLVVEEPEADHRTTQEPSHSGERSTLSRLPLGF